MGSVDELQAMSVDGMASTNQMRPGGGAKVEEVYVVGGTVPDR